MQQDATVPASLQHLAQANTTAEEYTLLMHFLDEVFPLQYPLYQPHIFEGGRGWLLALLLRTKPLYYAALALSSYHRRMSINQIISERCRAKSFVQQASQLEACLIEVQRAMKTVDHFIQHGPSGDGMGMVSSIVQLVFFEVTSLEMDFGAMLTYVLALRWRGWYMEDASERSNRHVPPKLPRRTRSSWSITIVKGEATR